MPKCLHVVHVAVEIDTDKISVLDGAITNMRTAAEFAVRRAAVDFNEQAGTVAKITVID